MKKNLKQQSKKSCTTFYCPDMLSKLRLKELKMIIQEEYGKDLSDSELIELANQLLSYFRTLKKLKLSK